MPHTVPNIYGDISRIPTLQLDKANGVVLFLAGATTVAWNFEDICDLIHQLERYKVALMPQVNMTQRVLDFYNAPPEGTGKDEWLPEKTADE